MLFSFSFLLIFLILLVLCGGQSCRGNCLGFEMKGILEEQSRAKGFPLESSSQQVQGEHGPRLGPPVKQEQNILGRTHLLVANAKKETLISIQKTLDELQTPQSH